VAPPDLQFFDRFGTIFTHKGRLLDIDKFVEVIHYTYREAKELLQQDLLFGLSDEQLGHIVFDRSKVDDTSDNMPGHGILGTERDRNWTLMKHIMESKDLFNQFFDDIGGIPKLRRGRALMFLEKIAHFRRLEYVLIHWLSGMPKRGTEAIRFKIVNLADRMRNFYFMFNHLSVVGLHNKTSANTGKDNVTLHFLPPTIATLIQRFYYFVADLERWIVGELFSPAEVSRDWAVYLFSSYGKRWTSQMLSDALQNQFNKVMGERINLQQFRHILPGITTHYNIESPEGSVLSIQAHQMGHSKDSDARLYSRTTDGHHQLTNQFCHNALDFCTRVHKLWGFYGDTPSVEKSRTYRKSIFDKLSGAEEQGLREQIQSMNVQLQEQKKINVEILGELRSLRELLCPERNPHLGKWPQPEAPALEIQNSSTFQVNPMPRLEIPLPASASYRPGKSHTNIGEVSIVLILLGMFYTYLEYLHQLGSFESRRQSVVHDDMADQVCLL
jgi:hypothetical protein